MRMNSMVFQIKARISWFHIGYSKKAVCQVTLDPISDNEYLKNNKEVFINDKAIINQITKAWLEVHCQANHKSTAVFDFEIEIIPDFENKTFDYYIISIPSLIQNKIK